MPAILTQKYRSFLAEQFALAISTGAVGAYVFIGRPSPWVDSANVAVSDTNPPKPVDDVQHIDFDYWRDLLAVKRVTESSTTFVVPRRNWTTGTVYDQYDDLDANLASKAYYVLDILDEPFKVYKCLWNALGAVSTVAPSTIDTALTPQQTADGYVWQYMYTVDSLFNKFLTTSWMPVLTDAAVISNALTFAGRLPTAVPLVILNGGATYNASQNVVTTLVGDGSGASVTNNDVQITGGVVSSVVLATGGLGYTEVTSINVFQAAAGTQATVRAIIPPYPNHGHDPIKELNATALMLTAQFDQSEAGLLTIVNDYRRVGLLINPIEAANGDLASASFYRQTTEIAISSNTGVLLRDDIITNVSKTDPKPTAIVVDVVDDGANNFTVRVVGVDDMGWDTPFAFGETIKNLTSSVEATVSGVTEPDLVPYSGSIVWVNQRTPITRESDQIEELKIVFPFK
jgi:hypothetical protein